jgi:hypothetical protein
MKMDKKILLSLAFGFVAGSLWLIAIRFLTINNDAVHYHANFAVIINGVRQEFASPLYYEEVQSCSESSLDEPKSRGHMHNQENSIVHVHDYAVTWEHFMANLGFGLSDSVLITDKGGVYADGQKGDLHFILNGESVDSVANRVIADKDVLLIDYSNENDQQLQEEYKSIPTDAHKYDDAVDPAGCSGSEPLTFTTRLKKSLGF